MLELFGGKFEQGETPMAAAEREVFEEYGGPVDFINREPIICPPYEVTGSDYKPKRFVVHAFLAQVVGKPYQPVSTEHIPQSGIWVNPLEIPHMQNVTKASKLAIKSLVVLF